MPVCFYCTCPGHIDHFSKERRQVSDNYLSHKNLWEHGDEDLPATGWRKAIFPRQTWRPITITVFGTKEDARWSLNRRALENEEARRSLKERLPKLKISDKYRRIVQNRHTGQYANSEASSFFRGRLIVNTPRKIIRCQQSNRIESSSLVKKNISPARPELQTESNC